MLEDVELATWYHVPVCEAKVIDEPATIVALRFAVVLTLVELLVTPTVPLSGLVVTLSLNVSVRCCIAGGSTPTPAASSGSMFAISCALRSTGMFSAGTLQIVPTLPWSGVDDRSSSASSSATAHAMTADRIFFLVMVGLTRTSRPSQLRSTESPARLR